MTAYIIRRVIIGFIILILVTMLVFLFVRLLPGDPLIVYMASYDIGAAQTIGEEEYEKLKAKFGLDKGIHIQYIKWAYGIFTGNWGFTFFGGRPVLDVILERFPATLLLMGSGMALAIIIGMLIGILGAVRRYSIFDYLATTGAMVALSFPTFWFGLMTIFIFSLRSISRSKMFILREASSIETASSANMKLGRTDIALATAILCICPPLSLPVWRPKKSSGGDKPTNSRSSLVFPLTSLLFSTILCRIIAGAIEL